MKKYLMTVSVCDMVCTRLKCENSRKFPYFSYNVNKKNLATFSTR